MDRVGRDEGVYAVAPQRFLEDLVERREAALRLQEAQPAERDAIVVAELLEREPEELRRGVGDHDADASLADAPQQAIREDARAPGVVDEDVAVEEHPIERIDRRLEVGVPAMVLDRVVLERQLAERLPRPVLVQDAREALGKRGGGHHPRW